MLESGQYGIRPYSALTKIMNHEQLLLPVPCYTLYPVTDSSFMLYFCQLWLPVGQFIPWTLESPYYAMRHGITYTDALYTYYRNTLCTRNNPQSSTWITQQTLSCIVFLYTCLYSYVMNRRHSRPYMLLAISFIPLTLGVRIRGISDQILCFWR